LPQACNQPASFNPLKRRDKRAPCSLATGIKHDGIDRDILPILPFRTNRRDRKALNDSLRAGTEADCRVFADDGAVERRRGHEKAQ